MARAKRVVSMTTWPLQGDSPSIFRRSAQGRLGTRSPDQHGSETPEQNCPQRGPDRGRHAQILSPTTSRTAGLRACPAGARSHACQGSLKIDPLRRRIATGHLLAVKLGYKLIRGRITALDKLSPAIPTTRPEDRYNRW